MHVLELQITDATTGLSVESVQRPWPSLACPCNNRPVQRAQQGYIDLATHKRCTAARVVREQIFAGLEGYTVWQSLNRLDHHFCLSVIFS